MGYRISVDAVGHSVVGASSASYSSRWFRYPSADTSRSTDDDGHLAYRNASRTRLAAAATTPSAPGRKGEMSISYPPRGRSPSVGR